MGVWSPQQSGQNILELYEPEPVPSPSLGKFSGCAKHNFNLKTPAGLGLIFFLKTMLRTELYSSQDEPMPYIFSACSFILQIQRYLITLRPSQVRFYFIIYFPTGNTVVTFFLDLWGKLMIKQHFFVYYLFSFCVL